MKKVLLTVLVMLASCVMFAGENLIRNTGFSADEYGEFGIWTLSQKSVGIVRLPGDGVDGKDAVRLDFSKSGKLLHTGLYLIGGAKYKFGGYVRTSGFSGVEYYGFMLHDTGWKKLHRTGRFFRNTHGRWMKIEQTVVIPADGIYQFNIYAPGPKGVLEVSEPFVIPLDEKGKAGSKLVLPPPPPKKVAEENMIKNVGFHSDFIGEFGIWTIYQRKVGITRLPGEGVNGKDAARLDMTQSGSLIHCGLKVVKNSRYRFGIYVRTKDFSGEEYYGVMFHNSGWSKMFRTRKFPSDTNGKWVKVESEMTAPEDGVFQFNIYAPGPKGVLEICEPFVIPLDEAGVKAAGISMDVLEKWQRIYPLSVELAALDAKKTEITAVAHYKLADAPENYILTAELCGQKKSVALNRSQRVNFVFENLPLGKGELKFQLVSKKDARVIHENRYLCNVVEKIGPVTGKQLNNLVTEISRFEKVRDGSYDFRVSDEGWYFIGLSKAEKNFTIHLNNAADPILMARENETPDTMRYLKPGNYQLRLKGITSPDNTLSVRKIKQLMLFPMNIGRNGRAKGFSYDMAFFRQRVWHTFNTQMLQHELLTPTGCDEAIKAEVHARGLRLLSSGDVGKKSNWTDPQIIENNLRTRNAIEHTDGRALDEIGSRYAFEIQLAVADAFWNLADFPKPFYLWMANIRGFLHFPPVSAPLLAAVGNSSGGQGVMLMETYMLSTPDQESYDRQLTALNDHLYWADRCIPGGRSRIGFMISGYTNNGVFNTWIHPETDYKCVVERFCRKLAVDPELTGFYAMGAYAMNRFDEELARWTAAVFRHYAIEGNTDSLAERYGFKFNPGFLQNGDFDNKTEGWTVEPAEEGSLKHFYQANFGKKPMGRQRNSGKHGDHAMLFVRSDKKPNKLSQRITGLTPGKKYSLLFVTADPDNVKKPGNELLKVVFNADISDSRTVADGSYQLVQPGPVATRYKRNENGEAVIDKIIPMPQIVTHKIVFVPEKPEVTITFSDWQDEKTPGGKIGEKRVINFISVNPFFED